jgi:hypothetical protein
MVAGEHARVVAGTLACSVTVVVVLLPVRAAVNVDVWVALTAAAVSVKEALVEPAKTVT